MGLFILLPFFFFVALVDFAFFFFNFHFRNGIVCLVNLLNCS